MSIPYNHNLSLRVYESNPGWYMNLDASTCPEKSIVQELLASTVRQPIKRSVQFLRDVARLALKVPLRAIATPIILQRNWQERERAKINAKLTGYAFLQLLFVPVKFVVALIALAVSGFSQETAQHLLNRSESVILYLDGRASQLEALKEEGAKKAASFDAYAKYRNWLYEINPKLCLKV